MTYCLGILTPQGIVMASDSRSNAGVDQITRVKKLSLFTRAEDRVICIMSAGNLGTTQSVVAEFRQGFGHGSLVSDLARPSTLFEVARLIGDKLRFIIARDAEHVRPYGDPAGSFLVGGQIAGEQPRLFLVYSAGNFIEATARNQFVQIGETKYGKPILDRALEHSSTLEEVARLALISFDATIRSNLSVGPPVDMLCYRKDSLSAQNVFKFSEGDAYLRELRRAYSEGLLSVVQGLPVIPYAL